MLSSALPQLLQLGKVAGGQLDFPAFACSKLDALDLDRAGANHLLNQPDQPGNAGVLRFDRLALQGLELRGHVDDAALLRVERLESQFILDCEAAGFAVEEADPRFAGTPGQQRQHQQRPPAGTPGQTLAPWGECALQQVDGPGRALSQALVDDGGGLTLIQPLHVVGQ
ncbi:hypothetical protein D9M69_441470 [compost metagenome]